mmetsp:Transcript_32495/g.73366  ORF Transcript_32495/g.73366 Transcript_32495/m.73366 type:complete len:95 (-) Transcript_32495:654-938(-)
MCGVRLFSMEDIEYHLLSLSAPRELESSDTQITRNKSIGNLIDIVHIQQSIHHLTQALAAALKHQQHAKSIRARLAEYSPPQEREHQHEAQTTR